MKDLTYSISNAPTGVHEQKHIDEVLGDALDTWSRVADINFRQVPAGSSAHIQIK